MAKILRWLLLGVLGTGFVAALTAMLFEPFANELWDQLGVDSSEWVKPILKILSSTWFTYTLLVVFGATLGMWGHHMAIRWDMRKATRQENRNRASSKLRLQFRDGAHPFEACNENVWRWFVIENDGHLKDGSRKTLVTFIYVVFDEPTSTRFPNASCSDPNVRIQFQDITERSAILAANGSLIHTTVDITVSDHPN